MRGRSGDWTSVNRRAKREKRENEVIPENSPELKGMNLQVRVQWYSTTGKKTQAETRKEARAHSVGAEMGEAAHHRSETRNQNVIRLGQNSNSKLFPTCISVETQSLAELANLWGSEKMLPPVDTLTIEEDRGGTGHRGHGQTWKDPRQGGREISVPPAQTSSVRRNPTPEYGDAIRGTDGRAKETPSAHSRKTDRCARSHLSALSHLWMMFSSSSQHKHQITL